VIVRFVDIGGIVDHHCFNFLFIIPFFKPFCLFVTTLNQFQDYTY